MSSASGQGALPQKSRGAPWASIGIAAILLVGVIPFVKLLERGSQQPRATVTQPADVCQSPPAREQCAAITVDGRTFRYALYRATSATTRTALVDVGGPGAAVLSGSHGIASLGRSSRILADTHNLLTIEEPWVTRTTTEDCDTALTSYYQSLRSATAVTPAATELRRACGVATGTATWGFDPQTYETVVEAIAAREKLQIRGFIGHSWGAVRLAYLKQTPIAWYTLIRPFPVGLSMSQVLNERAAKLRNLLTPQDLRPHHADSVEGRATPVAAFDRISAVIASGYQPAELSRARSTRGQAWDARIVARLSDTYWGRYGADRISPRLLAFLDEACGAVDTAEQVQPSHTVEGVLRAMVAPCLPSRQVKRPMPTRTPGCIITSPDDSVAPEALAKRALSHMDVRWHRSSIAQHTSFDGIDECVNELASLGVLRTKS